MKKKIPILSFITITIAIQFYCSLSLSGQNVGINTVAPQARLHIFKGSSGYVGAYPHQDLIIESNDHTWINMLAPNDKELGLLFGKPSAVVTGGIIHDIFNRLQFRTNGNITRMTIDGGGFVGIGTLTPNAPLSFPAVLGKKITLYPGASGDVGFGVQGNLLQIYSDYAGAAVAFGYGGSNSFHENMRIQGTGNVGIGTTNPVAKLDVAGNIRASEYNYTTPATFYYSIPASGLSSLSSSSILYRENLQLGGGAYFAEGKNTMVAAVNLPHLATVNQVIVYYIDDSFLFDLHVSLYRKEHVGNYELMGEFESIGQLNIESGEMDNINYPVINNAAYNYHLRVYSTANGDPSVNLWPDSELTIKSIVIRYTLASAQ